MAPRFLKDPAKIAAYGSLVSMAVLNWQVMQVVPSRKAERWGVSLPHPNGHPLATRHDHATHQGDFDENARVSLSIPARDVPSVGIDEVTWVERLIGLLPEVKIHPWQGSHWGSKSLDTPLGSMVRKPG